VPIPKTTVVGTLTSKLGFVPAPGDKHEWYVREARGLVIGKTHVSRGRRPVGDFELAAMARELFVPGPLFKGAISCSVGVDEFLLRMQQGLESYRRSFRR
jgi:hypothetical protein